jgi:hypothetical protein
MLNNGWLATPSARSAWLSKPYFGSRRSIQPIVSGSAGRKNDNQKKNSSGPFIGISVRAINHAKKAPMRRAIACLVIPKANVFVIALRIPGVVKAFVQPSSP